jgi:hypothetical protein
VYAWGSLEAGNLQLAVQNIEGLHSSPSGVPSGELGLADTTSPAPWWIAVTLLVAAAGTLAVSRRTPVRITRD